YRAVSVDLERQLRGACDIVRHFDQRVRITGDGSASDASRTASRHSRFRGRIGGIGAISGAAVGAATASLRSVAAPLFMNRLKPATPTPQRKASDDRRWRIEGVVCGVVTKPELIGRHLCRPENDIRLVVLGPVVGDDAIGLLHLVPRQRPGVWSEDRVRTSVVVGGDVEPFRGLEHGCVVPVEPQYY